MANLVITNACNLRCSFCFASEYRCGAEAEAGATASASAGGSSGAGASAGASASGCAPAQMSREELRRLIDFVGAETVRFCGGEPTLHPDFLAMLDEALAVPQRQAFIMTNGLWPEAVRERLGRLPAERGERVSYLINVLPPELYTEHQRRALEATLTALEPRRVTVGFTLSATDFDFTGIIALARRFAIRQLRYSVAAPTVSDPRSWGLAAERDFPALAAGVHRLEMEARRLGFTVQHDCGYVPPCTFSEAELRELTAGEDLASGDRFRCHGPVDIGPDGQAWRCYGLYSTLRASTAEFANAGELAAHFDERLAQREKMHLFAACADCDWRARGICGGGCHAFRAVRALRAVGEAHGVEIGDDESLCRAVVVIDGERLHLAAGRQPSPVMVRDAEGTWAALALGADELALLRALDRGLGVGRALDSASCPRAVGLRLIRQLLEAGGLRLRGRRDETRSA